MTNVQQTLINESALVIAQHYANKIIESGEIPTKQELAEAIANNWVKLTGEIVDTANAAGRLLSA